MIIIKFLFLVVSIFLTYSLFMFFSGYHKKIVVKKTHSQAVFWGAFLGLIILFMIGFNEMLIFIPESWGSVDEYGDWNSTRFSISILLGFFLAIMVMPKEAKKDNNL